MTAAALENTVVARAAGSGPQPKRPAFVVYVLAMGTFLMITTEFVVAGVLPEIAGDLKISLGQAGALITVFAIGMIVGAPSMALLTLRLSKRLTLILSLIVFVLGHLVVAVSSDFRTLMLARLVTAVATGAFWAVAAVVAARSAGPSLGARALGIVGAGGALATVIGVPMGAFVAQVVGWRGTFWLLAVAAAAAALLVARFVPHETPHSESTSIRAELAALRTGRLWLVLAACATTSGGVLAAYSYISPILTDKAGIPTSLVPLVLTGFGIGSLVGTLLGGRFGDARPHLLTIVTPAVSAVLLLLVGLLSGSSLLTAALVVLLGLFGLSANGVLINLAVRFSGAAAVLGSALSVSAFNTGTAVGTGLAGVAVSSSLGMSGPTLVGTIVVTLTLIPTITLALIARRRRTTTAEEA